MPTPAMSVVVAGSRPSGPPTELLRVLGPALQTGRIELLFATARDAGALTTPNTRVVKCRVGSTVPQMRLLGVRAARGRLVALTEDFCVPAPGWVDALIEAHRREGAAAVGGPVARSTGSAADWALTLIEYGRFFRGEPEGSVGDLPSINVAYDAAQLRAVLPADADGLFEVALHAQLRAAGARFWRVPDAVMFDHSTTNVRSAASAQFHHGRLYGGGRVQDQGVLTRLTRTALSPGIPAVLLSRIAREVGAAGQTQQLLRALPALSILLGAWSIGEAVGSMLGEGPSGARWTGV
ncbi:hypothetical protein [Gemmatimonas groenlandica]|uniref:Glycosyltransferase 2-like domain-containing protein n=1 Tax=Gemmatimonas groenlandica TaxID=2732249 RepID=A0A6M4IQK2_9BACT|nr:hypothetical protein [Gemmatimonas groenlandica]QJR34541.1 hypothetical protein HKW67_02905 [Gemmatimonas groenlandica]